ncbi:hypothetical protein [Streptomyces sp. NPDC005423]|uniref:hypothetical protein n=1 Tax=Streptomyces sp. NPDC005423 TaxID=3155343 RepID=UPI0033AA4600
MSDFDRQYTQDTNRSAQVAHTAQDKATEGAGLIGEKTSDVAHTAKDQATNTVTEATTQARNLLGEVREQVQGQSRAQTQQLAANVRRLADELHEMSENAKPDSTATTVVRQVADGGRQVASRLENRGPEGLVEDLRDFARRKPGLFLAGAAVAGFAAARLGKGISAAGSSTGTGTGATGTSTSPGPAVGTPGYGVTPEVPPQPPVPPVAPVPAAPVAPAPPITPTPGVPSSTVRDQGRTRPFEGN